MAAESARAAAQPVWAAWCEQQAEEARAMIDIQCDEMEEDALLHGAGSCDDAACGDEEDSLDWLVL